jgi:hypothetical protein
MICGSALHLVSGGEGQDCGQPVISGGSTSHDVLSNVGLLLPSEAGRDARLIDG